MRFEIDHESGEIVVYIIDRRTGRPIRTIPPSEIQEALQRFSRAPGRLVDRTG